MATVAYIDAHLDLNTGQFTGAINSAGAGLRNFGTNVNKTNGHVHKFHGNLMSTVVVLGQLRAAMHTVWAITGQWGYAIIQANAKLERLQVLMKGLSRAGTEAGKVTDALKNMNYVLDKAKTAPFSIDEIGNAFVKLKAAGIDPARGALDGLMNAVANFGGDDQTFHRATVAIQQMSGKGVISMEELRQQLGEAVPNAMMLLARATNMTMAELTKVISTGRLAAKPALEKLFREMKYEFDGSAAKMMDTWVGLMSRLKTEWLIFAREIGSKGMFDTAKKSIMDLMAMMNSDAGKAFARDLGQGLADALRLVVEFVGYLVRHREDLISWAKLVATIFVAKKITDFSTAIVTSSTAILGLTANFTKAGIASTSAAGAVARFAAGLSALAGPIGIAIGLVMGLTMHMNMQARATRGARDEWVSYLEATNRGEVVPPETLAKMKGDIKVLGETETALAALRKERDKTMTGLDGKVQKGFSFGESPVAHMQLNKMLDELRKRGLTPEGFGDKEGWTALLGGPINQGSFDEKARIIEKALKSVPIRMQVMMTAELNSAKAKAVKDVEGYTDGISNAIKDKLPNVREKLNEIDELRKAGTISAAENLKRRTAVLGPYYDAQIKSWEAAGNVLQVQLAKAKKEGKDVDGILTMIEANNAKVKELQAEKIASGDMTNELMPKMGGADDEKASKKKQNDLLSFYQSLEGRIEGLRSQLADGNVKLDIFDKMVSLGKYGNDKGLQSKVRGLLVTLDELNKQVKNQRVLEGIEQSLEDMAAAAEADVVTNALRLQTAEWDNAAKGVISFNREIAVMRLNMVGANATEGELAKFEENARKIADTLRTIDLQNFAAQTKDGAWQLYLDKLPQKARAQAEFNKKLLQYADIRKSLLKSDGSNAAQVDADIEARKALDLEAFMFDNRSSLQQWIDVWADTTDEMDALWGNSMDNIANSLTEMITTGKLGFKELAVSILKEITKVLVSKAVAQLAQLVLGLFGPSNFGSSGSTGITAAPNGATVHAKGGVFGPKGSMPLNMYANGGIANSPQMAIFGEGRMPEAYVPLPDGRNIPVKMEGGGSGDIQVNTNVTIMSDGTAKTDTASDAAQGRELGRHIEGKVKDILTQEMRPGGMIWKMRN